MPEGCIARAYLWTLSARGAVLILSTSRRLNSPHLTPTRPRTMDSDAPKHVLMRWLAHCQAGLMKRGALCPDFEPGCGSVLSRIGAMTMSAEKRPPLLRGGERLILTGQFRRGEADVICCAVAMPAPSPALRAPSPRWGEGARTTRLNWAELASSHQPTAGWVDGFQNPSILKHRIS
jgi:hypothetical protein